MEVAVQGGAKPDISIRSYTDQEWALLSYNEKGEVFALRDKYERQKINAVEIQEDSIAKIANILVAHNTGSEAAEEKEIPGNPMTGKTRGSA